MTKPIITDGMTLDEKLAAIDQAMQNAEDEASLTALQTGQPAVPIDPALLTICDGCE